MAINYKAYEKTTQRTKDNHIYIIEDYLGEVSGKHKYKIRFVECGRVKTVPYEQIRSNLVTYSFRKPATAKVNKKPSKNNTMKLIDGNGIKLLALDMATQKTGYAIFEEDTLISYGMIVKNHTDRYKRINMMIDDIIKLIQQYQITHIAVENIFLKDKDDDMRNVTSLIALANIQGALMYHTYKMNIYSELIAPVSWKSFHNILTRRNEGKKNAMDLVKDMLGISMQEDTSEAFLIGVYFLKNRVDWRK